MSDAPETTIYKQPPTQYPWVTQTLVLAIISALSYCYTYVYEWGFCSVYRIPDDLIKLDTVRLLIVGMGLLTIVSFSVMLFAYTSSHVVFTQSKMKWRVAKAIPALVLIGVILWGQLNFGIAILSFVVVSANVFLDIGIAEKRAGQQKTAKKPANMYEWLLARVGYGPVNVAVYILVIGLGAHSAGVAEAETKSRFLVLAKMPDLLVLRIYGDTMICAKADLAEHKLYPVFSFFKIDSEAAQGVELKHLKPMHLVDDTTPR